MAQVNRDADLPGDQTNDYADDLGNWETSGIIDVSEFFGFGAGELLLMDVQAHSVSDGSIEAYNLVQGGQLGFLAAPGVEI